MEFIRDKYNNYNCWYRNRVVKYKNNKAIWISKLMIIRVNRWMNRWFNIKIK